LGCTVLVGLSACVWSVAIGTDHWYTLKSPDDKGLPLGGIANTGRRLIYKHMGLWKGCITGLTPESENSTNLVPYGKPNSPIRLPGYHFVYNIYLDTVKLCE